MPAKATRLSTKAHPFALWCRSRYLATPIAEYRFHPERRWRFDWAFPEYKVAVEVHGSVWRQGRHTRGGGFLNDREKIGEAQAMGWRVFEVAPSGKHAATLYSPTLERWLRETLR